MTIQTRRQFLGTMAAGLAASPLLGAEQTAGTPRKKMAVVTTLWNYRSHAWHMAERFLVGYPLRGKWHRPPFEVVSAYVDQRPEGDLSGQRAKEFGFKIYPTVGEALRNGGDKMAVDAVLMIGEHGNYPTNEFGQKQYPRYELFQKIVEVYKKDGRTAPVFNDKHLSWNFAWAKEMVDQSHAMGFPFLAGSSLPVTWRMPAIELPPQAEVEEALCVAWGGLDIYDFHALETLQSFVERRRGGETGVKSIHGLKGDAVWKAMSKGSWREGGWNPRLFEACLSRSHTLKQPESYSHRYPTPEQIREWVKDPWGFHIEYNDGLRATLLMLNGLTEDFLVAAKLKGQEEPVSTLYYLPPNPNVVYSAALMANAEEMFVTGKAPYPVERTLLTSGMVQSGLQSLKMEKPLETPHLAVKYQPSKESTYWHS